MSEFVRHPELRKALSMVPYSPLFGILWPIIVDQASYETRLELRWINDYFYGLCESHRLSDEAKSVCFSSFMSTSNIALLLMSGNKGLC
jgi:hypothetical protein